MKDRLDTIDELFNALNARLPFEPGEKVKLDRKFRLEFNYNSNHLEGNTLTYGETELLLIFDNTKGNHNMREYEEMKAHDVAFQIVDEWARDTQRPLTEQFIKNLNEIILVRPYWKDAVTQDGQQTRREIQVGNYKEFANSVRLQNGEIFHYAQPADTPILMEELVNWYRDEEKHLHPVTLAAMLHYKFVCIHPFDDGNGRISRLLMNYVLLKFGYPPVIIKSADKANYLRALHLADTGDYSSFISYIAEQLIWSLKLSIKAAKGEPLEDDDDFIKEIELLKRKASIKSVPKSPKIVYDTFKMVDTKIWRSLELSLFHFDALFLKVTNAHSVKKSSKISTDYSVPATALKIWGLEVYRNSIEQISWSRNMFSLKNAESNADFKVFLLLNFDILNYTLTLEVSGNDEIVKVLSQVKKNYDESLLFEEIDELNKVLRTHLLAEIKMEIHKNDK